MPRFQNAYGYLLELKGTVNHDWFNAAVELAIESDGTAVSKLDLEKLWNFSVGIYQYSPSAASLTSQQNIGQGQTPTVFLKEINTFKNFKRLSSNLDLNFEKKITIIFGKNGSGKSSVCEAFKVLANPNSPATPLKNVRGSASAEPPSFSYKFDNWDAPSLWSEARGFGTQAQFIKYFDSTVAAANSTGNMVAENAVQIVAFRLEVFDYVRSIVVAFQNFCSSQLNHKSADLQKRMDEALGQIKEYVDIESPPFNLWSLESPQNFENWFQAFQDFQGQQGDELLLLENQLKQHQAAASEQGQIVLKTQFNLLKDLDSKITLLLSLSEGASPENLAVLEANLSAKKSAQIELSKNVMPDGQFSEQHQRLIIAASAKVPLVESETCPLCFQSLPDETKILFQAYHAHLTSSLQREIDNLAKELQIGLDNQSKIRSIDFGDLSVLETVVSNELLSSIQRVFDIVKNPLPDDGKPQASGNLANYNLLEEMRGYLEQIKTLIAQIDNTLKIAITGRDQLKKTIEDLQLKISKLVAQRILTEKKQDLLKICGKPLVS